MSTTVESPAPRTTNHCHGILDGSCVLTYNHTKKANGTRAFSCSTHHRWVYEFPKAITFTYKNSTSYSRNIP